MQQAISAFKSIESDERFTESNEFRLIEKKYVHKENPDNVHIYNVRRAIPRFIFSFIFENDLLNSITRDEFTFLSRYYIKMHTGKINDLENYTYSLKSLPLKIKIDELDNILLSVNREDSIFVKSYYIINEEEGCYILSEIIDELEELRLANILNMQMMLIKDSEKALISEILEKVKTLSKEEVYYANMHIDPEHYYFFEHSLDHVSGMMVIETARQFFVSCAHIFGKVPTSKEVEFILSNLNSKFHDYLLLSYPIRLKLVMDQITYTKEGFWNSVSSNISFCQEYKDKAVFNISGIIMNKIVLDKVVSKKMMKNVLSRKDSMPEFQNEFYLKDISNDIGFFGNIVDISPNHITSEFRIPIIFEKTDCFNFIIHFEKNINAHGKCSLEWQQESDELSVVRFKIDELDDINRDNIIKIIKRLSQIREMKMVV